MESHGIIDHFLDIKKLRIINLKYLILGITYLSFIPLNFLRGEVIQLNNDYKDSFLTKEISYFEDKNEKLLFTDILNDNEIPFKKYEKNALNFYISKSVFWLKFEIKNNSNHSDYWLEIINSYTDDIKFYYFTDSWNEMRDGDEADSKNTLENSNLPMFPLFINKGDSKTYFIRIKSHEALELPIRIQRETEIMNNLNLRKIFIGFYTGSILSLFIYNFVIYVILRDKVFGLYSLYILTQILTISYLNGSLPPLFIFQIISKYSNNIILVSLIFGSFFTMEYLDTKSYTPIIHLFLKRIIYFTLSISLVEIFIDRHFASVCIYIASISIVILFIIAGFSVYKKGNTFLKFFLLSWILLIISIFIQIFVSVGIISLSIYSLYSIHSANVLLIILISLSLVDKLDFYKKIGEKAIEISEKKIEEAKKNIQIENQKIEVQFLEKTNNIHTQKIILEEKNKILEKEISMAGKLQMSLMPGKDKEFKNLRYSYLYKPMMSVGGDFIDIREGKKNTHIGVFICDISGHGIVASLIASMVKISLQNWLNYLHKPAMIPDLVLSNLTGKLDKNFLTAIVGFINTRTGEFKYSNAGHPPLAYLPKNGKPIYLNTKGKMIVEIMKPNCEEKSLLLNDGDKIILFTDGITEARNLNGEMLTEETFLEYLETIKMLSPTEIVDTISTFLDEFTGSSAYEDDCALLVFEFQPKRD